MKEQEQLTLCGIPVVFTDRESECEFLLGEIEDWMEHIPAPKEYEEEFCL